MFSRARARVRARARSVLNEQHVALQLLMCFYARCIYNSIGIHVGHGHGHEKTRERQSLFKSHRQNRWLHAE